jgi:hypothetical protein
MHLAKGLEFKAVVVMAWPAANLLPHRSAQPQEI